MAFSYTITRQKGTTVFKLEGEIMDKAQAADFIEYASNLVASGDKRFVLDLSGIKYMNSSGLNIMVNILTKARNAGGEVVVCNVTKKVSDLLVITKLDTIFHILPAVEDGIKKLNES